MATRDRKVKKEAKKVAKQKSKTEAKKEATKERSVLSEKKQENQKTKTTSKETHINKAAGGQRKHTVDSMYRQTENQPYYGDFSEFESTSVNKNQHQQPSFNAYQTKNL